MSELVVGILLTALFGGFLVPTIRAAIDRRREQCSASTSLLETFAASLWTYWKFAMRVAYYGRDKTDSNKSYTAALERWDSDDAWTNGCEIQIQVSRAKRLLPKTTHDQLEETQRAVVEDLDLWIDYLQTQNDPQAWGRFYTSLTSAKRLEIEEMLAGLSENLAFAQRSWGIPSSVAPIRRVRIGLDHAAKDCVLSPPLPVNHESVLAVRSRRELVLGHLPRDSMQRGRRNQHRKGAIPGSKRAICLARRSCKGDVHEPGAFRGSRSFPRGVSLSADHAADPGSGGFVRGEPACGQHFPDTSPRRATRPQGYPSVSRDAARTWRCACHARVGP